MLKTLSNGILYWIPFLGLGEKCESKSKLRWSFLPPHLVSPGENPNNPETATVKVALLTLEEQGHGNVLPKAYLLSPVYYVKMGREKERERGSFGGREVVGVYHW